MTNNRKFGVELEIIGLTAAKAVEVIKAAGIECFDAGYTHAVHPIWKVVSDSSVSGTVNGVYMAGCEVVSPVLSGEAGLQQVAMVCKALTAAGATVNKSCGFHVHVDASDLDLAQMKRVVKTWVKFEDSVDLLVAPSRRDQYFCRSNVKNLVPAGYGHGDEVNVFNCKKAFEMIDAATSIDALRMLFNNDRYRKLNLEAYYRHRTVEVRQHQGTVDAEKACAWVRLCLGLVSKAAGRKALQPRKQHGHTAADRLCYLFDAAGLSAADKRYFRSRAKKFATATA